VYSLHVAPEGGAPVRTVESATAVEERGLEGDRYFDGTGTFSKNPGTGRHVTLIELEALTALSAEYGIGLAPADARRNVVTSGVPLNHLLGREFRVGDVVLRGMRLCEPCSHLAQLTEAGVLAGLVHRGGLRADIVRGGTIRVGDSILPV
jgi:MOSC domain-containing protein YiiM